jgi:single-stranded DNA-specific DHH superfamily exonuclease
MSVVAIVKGQVGQHVHIEGGGHPAAMGFKLALKDYDHFSELFDKYVKQAANESGINDAFTPSIKIDHYFQSDDLFLLDDLELLSDISTLEPYGIKFESPIFAIKARVLNISTFGKGDNAHAHANVVVLDEMGRQRRITVFSYAKCPWMECCIEGRDVEIAFTVNYDAYRNRVGLLSVGMTSPL